MVREVKETLKHNNIRIYKYVFIFDTNLCFNNRFSYDVLSNRLLKELIEIRDEYNYNNSAGSISLFIPQIVKDERLFQKKQVFNTHKPNILSKLKELQDTDLIKKFEEILSQYDVKLQANLDEVLQKDKIFTMPYCEDKYLKEIIKKAVDKKTPFRPVKIDKGTLIGEQGFKDCILWYSIFSYAATCNPKNPTIFVLLTNNVRDFKNADNIKEFEDKTSHKIRIIDYAIPKKELNNMFLEDFQNYPILQVDINYTLKEDVSTIRDADIHSDGIVFNISIDKTSYDQDIELQKTEILSNIEDELGRNIPIDTKVNFIKNNIEYIYVSVEYYKWFYRISSIELNYANGDSEEVDDDIFDGREWVLLEDDMGDTEGFERDVFGMLKGAGYECDGVSLDYEVTERTEED